MNSQTQAFRRIFFALWPDDAVRARLEAVSLGLLADGRPVPARHLHLTLAFPGQVPVEAVEGLRARAAQVVFPRLRLRLDRIACFKLARVAWIGPSEPVEGLTLLADQLADICRTSGLPLDERPFQPHVSLRRFVTRVDPQPPEPIEWLADEMVMIESGRDGRPGAYRIIDRWMASPESTPG